MRNFVRCLRVAWNYRVRLILSVVCALLAAVFWSANFLAVHPVLKILGQDHSLSDSVQADIDTVVTESGHTREKLERHQTELQELDAQQNGGRDNARRDAVVGQIGQEKWKLGYNGVLIYRLKLLKRLYDYLLPADRFRALLWLMGAVIVSFAIKGMFEIGQDSLVGS